ncbi:MAG TPA: class II aldolase/adducin family protein [Acidobacteriaceae bacterium]|jgi:L-fuculose-phosphate aldolase|nr:class II aldolase/adducin family protein [Acidobacteriaceae bacterium]
MSTLLQSEMLADRTLPDGNDPRRDIIRFGRWLYRLGFAPGTAGNLSVRLDDETFLVTPTGVSKYLLRRRDIVRVDGEGRLLEGTRRPTSELGMHIAFYRLRPDVHAVIHAHPPIATAFACAGRALDELICQEAAMTLGPVPLARYATTGTDEVAASLRPLIPGHEAVLLANHGAVTCGSSLADAFFRMETLEHLAQIRLAAEQLGACRTLEQEQMDRLRRARERYIRNASESGLREAENDRVFLA